MATFFALPPLPRPTGGLVVLHRLASALRAAGMDVRLAAREERCWSPEFSREIPAVPWDLARPGPDDVWLAPEGWVGLLAPGLAAGARCLVYVQNWAYLFSSLPEGVAWDRLAVRFLAVSRPVAWHIGQALGVEPPVLRPGIDLALFAPPAEKPAAPPVRVAWMPRKNSAQGRMVMDFLAARQARGLCPPLEWVEIAGQDPAGVAERLRSCHLFLVTGFPEGCPLPPLEAMASGCLPVGFAGFGGHDYMRQADPDLPGAARPWWPTEHGDEFPGNGLWVADADAPAAALALERAARRVLPGSSGRHLHRAALEGCADTARRFSLEAQAAAAVELWRDRLCAPGAGA
ncbi:MAG: glycosyltransferase family 1 protein [Thermodesulfobacteriota bacterium]